MQRQAHLDAPEAARTGFIDRYRVTGATSRYGEAMAATMARLPRRKQTRRPWVGRRPIVFTESIGQPHSTADRHSQRLLLHFFVIDAFLLCIASQVLAFLRHLSEDGRRAQCEKGKQERNERPLHVCLLWI